MTIRLNQFNSGAKKVFNIIDCYSLDTDSRHATLALLLGNSLFSTQGADEHNRPEIYLLFFQRVRTQ